LLRDYQEKQCKNLEAMFARSLGLTVAARVTLPESRGHIG
jgi:hypothetical protein